MIPVCAANVVQYFGFAMHMAQQIAYLHEEDELLSQTGHLAFQMR